ncbi:MAG: uroporphyrinogen decarboxylase family protein [Eubacteriales bacterium]
MKKSPEELYQEREKRIQDAIALRVPDRVPILGSFQSFPCFQYGITMEEAFNNYDKASELFDMLYKDFQPDLAWDPVFMYPAKAMERLDMKWLRWAGHGVHSNSSVQYLEGEYMTADDYDELIHDPSCYMISKYIPYSFGALEGFKHFANLRDSLFLGWFSSLYSFALPEVQESLKAAIEVGEELSRWFNSLFVYREKLKKNGFPLAWGAFSWAPFDLIADTLRGTIPALMDMRRNPDKLLAAIEAFTPVAIEAGINSAKIMGNPYVWIWLHKGVDTFMSQKQFETFYWPSLKKTIEAFVDAGLVPVVYGEGQLDTRYETFRDVPKGKVIYHFETADMFRAKDVLGDVACIAGNVSNTLLAYGTPDDIKNYCKKLIDYCGKGGGFIMDTGALVDEAKFENVKAMFEFTQTYGVY